MNNFYRSNDVSQEPQSSAPLVCVPTLHYIFTSYHHFLSLSFTWSTSFSRVVFFIILLWLVVQYLLQSPPNCNIYTTVLSFEKVICTFFLLAVITIIIIIHSIQHRHINDQVSSLRFILPVERSSNLAICPPNQTNISSDDAFLVAGVLKEKVQKSCTVVHVKLKSCCFALSS